MECLVAQVTLMGFIFRVSLAMGDQGGNAVEGFMACFADVWSFCGMDRTMLR